LAGARQRFATSASRANGTGTHGPTETDGSDPARIVGQQVFDPDVCFTERRKIGPFRPRHKDWRLSAAGRTRRELL
jgi:hypothetical protein